MNYNEKTKPPLLFDTNYLHLKQCAVYGSKGRMYSIEVPEYLSGIKLGSR